MVVKPIIYTHRFLYLWGLHTHIEICLYLGFSYTHRDVPVFGVFIHTNRDLTILGSSYTQRFAYIWGFHTHIEMLLSLESSYIYTNRDLSIAGVSIHIERFAYLWGLPTHVITWPLAIEQTLSYAAPQCVRMLYVGVFFYIFQVTWPFDAWK